jgi:dimeric dUTPase (all-alpha-NTP-PPase superfamily)
MKSKSSEYQPLVLPDKLDELFKMQREFQDEHGYWPDLHHVCAAGAAEFLELWAKSGGKWWKKHKVALKEEQVEELVDVLHFFLLACLKLEITPLELFDAYKEKLNVNIERAKNNY